MADNIEVLLGLVDSVTDYLCEQEYDIGGREELRKHVASAVDAALAAMAAQPEAQAPAFDFFGLFDFLDAAHVATGRDKTEGSHGADLDLWRKRAFNAAVLQKYRGITTLAPGPEARVIGYVERMDAGFDDIRRLWGDDSRKLVQRIPFGYPVAILPTGINNWDEQPEAQAGGEVDVTGFGTPPLMHDERADAEKGYSLTAFDYAAAPIGSRDWTIYWRGWWHRSLVYGDTTPPPSAAPEGMGDQAVADAIRRMDECRAGCDVSDPLYDGGDPFYADTKAWDTIRAMLAAAQAKAAGRG